MVSFGVQKLPSLQTSEEVFALLNYIVHMGFGKVCRKTV